MAGSERFRVASVQLDIELGATQRNLERLAEYTRRAANDEARLVVFPECALSGYLLDNLDELERLAEPVPGPAIGRLAEVCAGRQVYTVVGLLEKGADAIYNSAVLVGPEGLIALYRKAHLPGLGLDRFVAHGNIPFAVHETPVGRIGMAICYDIRFPELYRQYHKLGARLLFHSFYNARQKPGSIHPKIMPPTAQARAATNNLFLSVNNSCAPNSWESLFVTPDGLIQERLVLDEPGVMINLVDTGKRYYDASRAYRLDSINGKLNSGRTVDDPRSKDRRAY